MTATTIAAGTMWATVADIVVGTRVGRAPGTAMATASVAGPNGAVTTAFGFVADEKAVSGRRPLTVNCRRPRSQAREWHGLAVL
jgi:hypothetical protein